MVASVLASLAASVPIALSDLLDPGGGPDQTGDFRISPTFFVALMGAGFAVGVAGHVIRSRTLVAAGVAMIFLATMLLPIAVNVAN